ncbi:flagellar basal body rod protein FlgC [Terribacillus saccharophilus]|uniref:Flagellar basal-body rod protein FlgC n=1 Tax=Terribacillus saccharophilus TaxID=361277 RepID=A0A268AAE6_9BACI|nr:flagellar basal body rod protein FlgC [Terribacillus saccharophilus]PAD21096.1 flagellar basal body rod protein FlgC [Terribacillus saccharophilus]PAF17409.1 flagellar basal body rod protein FlgC [Terribacillus saccharophilus]PAF22177.1 flagellar basal body rod protein FlgC [Terribacillus saccharophilus]PAF38370.1 flagellar basal body rod protein FlgC [Terribacillus saccharophilus]
MTIFSSLNTSASALTAQRLRMDVVSSNIANAETTRATIDEDGNYVPYRRKMVSLETQGTNNFSSFLERAQGKSSNSNGVRVSEITEDESEFQMVYNPTSPDANEEGYVAMPNVDPLKEMTDLMSATRSYEANVTAMNATKGMLQKALEIGK